MSQPFLSQIHMAGFNFAPRNYSKCDGQLIAISQNQALYALLGTMYGGNGVTTFALPDLRGRTPVHHDTGLPQGARLGYETIPLSSQQIPAHTHQARASTNAAEGGGRGGSTLFGKFLAKTETSYNLYQTNVSASLTPLRQDSISSAGGGQGHNNMQPSMVISFIIAVQGLFPSRN